MLISFIEQNGLILDGNWLFYWICDGDELISALRIKLFWLVNLKIYIYTMISHFFQLCQKPVVPMLIIYELTITWMLCRLVHWCWHDQPGLWMVVPCMSEEEEEMSGEKSHFLAGWFYSQTLLLKNKWKNSRIIVIHCIISCDFIKVVEKEILPTDENRNKNDCHIVSKCLLIDIPYNFSNK